MRLLHIRSKPSARQEPTSWLGLSHPDYLAQNCERRDGSAWYWRGLLRKAVSARCRRKERSRVYSFHAQGRRIPESNYASKVSFHAQKGRDASMVLFILDRYQGCFDSRRAPSTISGRISRTPYSHVLFRRRRGSRSISWDRFNDDCCSPCGTKLYRQ